MKIKKIHKLVYVLVSVVIVGGIGSYIIYQNHLKIVAEAKIEKARKEADQEARLEAAAKKAFAALFTDPDCKIIKLDVDQQSVKDTRSVVEAIKNKKLKNYYEDRFAHIVLFMEVRDEVDRYLPSGILRGTTTDDEIEKLKERVSLLEEGFIPILQGKMDIIATQRQSLKDLELLVMSFYEGDVVRSTVNMQAFYRLQTCLQELAQRDVADAYQGKVLEIQTRIDELEAAAHARAEAERQAAIAAQIAESQRIARENAEREAANVRIENIPYINQKNGVLNGCEGAALLMGLQHFGIAKDLTLIDIANAMPKHENDPHQGFIYDIFTTYPTNVPHWIAPDALATFGQQYASSVQDISGADTNYLKAEIDAGNPVIIYATYGFANPTGWTGEVPNNLHVMLLAGYNKITGNYIVIDPWGGILQNISASAFETQYNTMKKAVVIRAS